MLFEVEYEEVWVRIFQVEANSPEEALRQMIGEYVGDYEIAFEYSHTLATPRVSKIATEENK